MDYTINHKDYVYATNRYKNQLRNGTFKMIIHFYTNSYTNRLQNKQHYMVLIFQYGWLVLHLLDKRDDGMNKSQP